MEIVKEYITKRTKNQLEDRLISIINEFKTIECVECIAFSSFFTEETGQVIAGLTMVCDSEESRTQLENNNQILEYVDDIKIGLGFTTREEILSYRDRFFKLAEHIIVDKKDYKELQANMREFKTPFENLVDFQPPLSFDKKNTR